MFLPAGAAARALPKLEQLSTSSTDAMASSSGRQDLPYWTVTQGSATRTGYSCRECKGVIMKGDAMVVRDGRRVRFFYHADCYSGEADPRSQPHSSYASGRWQLPEQPPPTKYKHRTE